MSHTHFLLTKEEGKKKKIKVNKTNGKIRALNFKEFQVEVRLCLTGSPKKLYVCYWRNSKFGRMRAWVPESPALTEPLVSTEWRETPARAHGTPEVLLSLHHPFHSKLTFKTDFSHPAFSYLFKASKQVTLTSCVKQCTATTKLNLGICNQT